MNDITTAIHDILSRQLLQKDIVVVGIIPLPQQNDRMVRLNTIQEIIEEAQEKHEAGTVEYLLQVRSIRGKSDLQLQNFESSKAVLTEDIYLSTGKLNIPYLIKNGEILIDSGEYPLARKIFNAVLRSGESAGFALFALGRCSEAEGRLDEAVTQYEESIAYEPCLETFHRLAALFTSRGRDHQAAEVLERALELKNLNDEIRLELYKAAGNSWARASRFENSELNFLKALDLCPSGDDIRSNLGAICLQGMKIPEAKRHFSDAAASNPRNSLAYSGLGSCYLVEKNTKAAHDAFAQSLELDINNPTSILHLVQCAYETKSFAVATQYLKKYLEVGPINSNLLFAFGGLQFHMGKVLEAKATVLKVLNLQPEHTGAKELLALIERYL